MSNIDVQQIDRINREIFLKQLGVETIEKKPNVKNDEKKQDVSENSGPLKNLYENVDFKGAIKSVNELVHSINNKVAFSVDEESDQRVIKVFDRETGDIIRQIPKEDMIRLIVKLKEIQGIIFSQKA